MYKKSFLYILYLQITHWYRRTFCFNTVLRSNCRHFRALAAAAARHFPRRVCKDDCLFFGMALEAAQSNWKIKFFWKELPGGFLLLTMSPPLLSHPSPEMFKRSRSCKSNWKIKFFLKRITWQYFCFWPCHHPCWSHPSPERSRGLEAAGQKQKKLPGN